MARLPSIPSRKRIFVGTEGESERAFAAWLQQLCNQQRQPVHLDISLGSGGDSRQIVEDAVVRYRERSRRHGRFVDGCILLDADRLRRDQRHGRNPETVAGSERLRLVFLKPNLEGLLVRLHPNCENRQLSAHNVEAELRRLWPEYRKPASSYALGQRFGLEDLRRVCRRDEGLASVLKVLGLS